MDLDDCLNFLYVFCGSLLWFVVVYGVLWWFVVFSVTLQNPFWKRSTLKGNKLLPDLTFESTPFWEGDKKKMTGLSPLNDFAEYKNADSSFLAGFNFILVIFLFIYLFFFKRCWKQWPCGDSRTYQNYCSSEPARNFNSEGF